MLLMLGNVVPLWETMLAAMKLGAVVIPATTLLTPSDLADRVERGRVRHVVTACGRRAEVRGLGTRMSRASRSATRRRAGIATTICWQRDAAFTPDGETEADDPLLLYFTSGTTAKPKLVLH